MNGHSRDTDNIGHKTQNKETKTSKIISTTQKTKMLSYTDQKHC
jgi:hypothetical protein